MSLKKITSQKRFSQPEIGRRWSRASQLDNQDDEILGELWAYKQAKERAGMVKI